MSDVDPVRLFVIFTGAGAGGLLRYLLAAAVQSRAGGAFPHGTLWVNILGCLAIGIFFGLRGPRRRFTAAPATRAATPSWR